MSDALNRFNRRVALAKRVRPIFRTSDMDEKLAAAEEILRLQQRVEELEAENQRLREVMYYISVCDDCPQWLKSRISTALQEYRDNE